MSYYHIKVGDIIRFYEGNTTLSIQDGDQVSEGVEAVVIANPFAGFNVNAGYGYNYSIYTKTTTAQTGLRPTNAGPERLAKPVDELPYEQWPCKRLRLWGGR